MWKDARAWKPTPSSVPTGMEVIFALQLEFLGPTLGHMAASNHRVDVCGWELHLLATAKYPCLILQPHLPSTRPVQSPRLSPFSLLCKVVWEPCS